MEQIQDKETDASSGSLDQKSRNKTVNHEIGIHKD